MFQTSPDETALALVRSFEKLQSSDSDVQDFLTCINASAEEILYSLLDIVMEFINKDEKLVLRACQLINLEMAEVDFFDETELLKTTTNALQVCTLNEKIFCTLLQVPNSFNDREFQKILNSDIEMKKSLVTTLFSAFTKLSSYHVLKKTFETIGMIYKLIPKDIENHLEKIFNQCYDALVLSEANLITSAGGVKPSQDSILKMIILMEDDLTMWYLDFFKYDTIAIICQNHTKDPKDSTFPMYSRLLTILLRRSHSVFINNMQNEKEKAMQMPYDWKFVVDVAAELMMKLMEIVDEETMNLLDAKMVLISVMELMYCFYLGPESFRVKNRLLMVNQPTVTGFQMKKIIAAIEFHVFQVDAGVAQVQSNESLYNVQFQRDILLRMSEMLQYRLTLPYKSFYLILQHYSWDSKFVVEFEPSLKQLHVRKILPLTISCVMLRFAKNDSPIIKFKRFKSSMESFLNRFLKKDEYEISEIKSEVCKCVFQHFEWLKTKSPAASAVVLDYLKQFADGIGKSHGKKL